ncbi:hypothetical protein, partial [Leptothrix ochracea]|uniref:hypothetical protein n=1 Tax=Leptothrix ochracea TaxID=735331 RepID=UPI0034E29D67
DMGCTTYFVPKNISRGGRDISVAHDFPDRIEVPGSDLSGHQARLLIDLCHQHGWQSVVVQSEEPMASKICLALNDAGIATRILGANTDEIDKKPNMAEMGFSG